MKIILSFSIRTNLIKIRCSDRGVERIRTSDFNEIELELVYKAFGIRILFLNRYHVLKYFIKEASFLFLLRTN